MLSRIGADPIGGADPDRASGFMPRLALGSGGVERGIRTAGIRVGIPVGAQIRGVTTATGTDVDAPLRVAVKNGPAHPRRAYL
jgi:hypothetical protein